MFASVLKKYSILIKNIGRKSLWLVLFSSFYLQSFSANAATENGRWQAGVGDPTIFGWLTVIIYLIATIRCFFKAQESKDYGGNFKFWIYLGVFLLLLGINKQLDLQTLLTQTVRDIAKAGHWYADREPVQIGFIVMMGFGMFVAVISLRMYLAHSWHNYKVTWIGLIVLLTFILIRAASFHHMDVFINRSFLGLSYNAILEIGALVLIIIGTFYNKKSVVPLTGVTTVSLQDYVEITKEGNPVQCPKCGIQPLHKAVDGRFFKCRSCGHPYYVRLIRF
jgi:uncharacterized protein (DUF983 family)